MGWRERRREGEREVGPRRVFARVMRRRNGLGEPSSGINGGEYIRGGGEEPRRRQRGHHV